MSQTLTHRTVDLSRKDFHDRGNPECSDLVVIGEDDNFELADGEIVPIQAKTHWHPLFKTSLIRAVLRALHDR